MPEYWIVDPEAPTVEVLVLASTQDQLQSKARAGETVTSATLLDLTFELWRGWAKRQTTPPGASGDSEQLVHARVGVGAPFAFVTTPETRQIRASLAGPGRSPPGVRHPSTNRSRATRVVKWTLAIIASIVALAVGGLYIGSEWMLWRRHDVPPARIHVASSPRDLAEGR